MPTEYPTYTLLSKEDCKAKILDLLSSIKRAGINNLIEYLTSSDFFNAPASTVFHGNTEGGLARHSLNVYNLLREKVDRYYPNGEISDESVKISALLHDAAKINLYYKDFKWAKDADNKWFKDPCWKSDDTNLPLGHGAKSMYVVQRYIQLSEEEAAAILWHMGPFDNGAISPPVSYSFNAATQKYPIVPLIHTADMEATFILEKELSTPLTLDK